MSKHDFDRAMEALRGGEHVLAYEWLGIDQHARRHLHYRACWHRQEDIQQGRIADQHDAELDEAEMRALVAAGADFRPEIYRVEITQLPMDAGRYPNEWRVMLGDEEKRARHAT